MLFASSTLPIALAISSLAGVSSGHSHALPGSIEFHRRANFHKVARRSLASCHEELSERGGVYERAIERRRISAARYRQKTRSPALATDHKSSLTGVTNNTAAATLFTGNASCVLAPETTEGPYYVGGEYMRWDIREDVVGIDTYIDVQLIDIHTCKPVPRIYLDFWHANSTGVYSGVVASGNGNNTFLRGIQGTDDDGVAQFLTKFPGHYTGRATHIHILAHANPTIFDNGTLVSSRVTHVGQFFMDQSIITQVETTAPYTHNTQQLTTNEEDSILSGEAESIDPFLEYVLLGDTLADGLMMWGAMGIDTSANYTASAAVTLTDNGGVENPNAAPGGGPAGGPGGSMSGGPGRPGASGTASAIVITCLAYL
ncbi:Intradiol ring-cleavage dioxygenase [Mycena rebaudengoi]|nr:Intradiol ring-cleavage dioxygenase [Mycena rebaudengoi]